MCAPTINGEYWKINIFIFVYKFRNMKIYCVLFIMFEGIY